MNMKTPQFTRPALFWVPFIFAILANLYFANSMYANSSTEFQQGNDMNIAHETLQTQNNRIVGQEAAIKYCKALQARAEVLKFNP